MGTLKSFVIQHVLTIGTGTLQDGLLGRYLIKRRLYIILTYLQECKELSLNTLTVILNTLACTIADIWGGGGGNALTMTTTPWSTTPWSMVKKFDHDHDTLDFAHGQWSMVKIGHGHGQKKPILTNDRGNFEILAMTPGSRPNGQKIVVILPPTPPPPPPNLGSQKQNYPTAYQIKS